MSLPANTPKKRGHPRLIETALEFRNGFEEWKEIALTETIEVEVPKANPKTGEPLRMRKPKPPLIESFCRYVKISDDVFNRYSKAVGFEDYHEVAREVKEFCTTKLLEYMMLGYVSEKAAIFYMVNNSRYADVSQVIQTDGGTVKPAWLTGTRVEINEQNKGLPHESIDFEDQPGNK
jgi:hypothetical protein